MSSLERAWARRSHKTENVGFNVYEQDHGHNTKQMHLNASTNMKKRESISQLQKKKQTAHGHLAVYTSRVRRHQDRANHQAHPVAPERVRKKLSAEDERFETHTVS